MEAYKRDTARYLGCDQRDRWKRIRGILPGTVLVTRATYGSV